MIEKLDVAGAIKYALAERAHMLTAPDNLDICSRVRSLLGSKAPPHDELMAAVRSFRRRPPLSEVLPDPALRATLSRSPHHCYEIEIARLFDVVCYLGYFAWGGAGGNWQARCQRRAGSEEVMLGVGAHMSFDEARARALTWCGVTNGKG